MRENISLKQAIFTNAFFKYLTIIIQIIINSVLARLISPSEFGIVAILTVFTNFFTILSDLGIGSGIIQYKNLKQNDYNNIFSFTFYLAICLSIIFCLISFFIAHIYDNSIYILLCTILSISIFFNTLNMVPNAILLKNKKFKDIGIRTCIVVFIGGCFTIILSLFKFSFYSIIINSVFTSFFIFLWNMKFVTLQFSFTFDWKSINMIKRFSFYQFLFSLVNYFSRNFDNLLIGLKMSPISLGYYDRSYKLMTYPITILPNVINPVLHPILSAYQNDKYRIFLEYTKILKILAVLAIPINIICFFSAKEIILIMYGSKWEMAIPCFKCLALSIFFQIVTSLTGSIFQSLGKTKTMFITGLTNTSISIIAILIGINFDDINLLAIMVSIAYFMHFLIANLILIRIGFGYRFNKFFIRIWKELIMLVIMYISICLYPFNISNIILSLIMKVFWVCTFYLIILIVSGDYKFILSFFRLDKRRKI